MSSTRVRSVIVVGIALLTVFASTAAPLAASPDPLPSLVGEGSTPAIEAHAMNDSETTTPAPPTTPTATPTPTPTQTATPTPTVVFENDSSDGATPTSTPTPTATPDGGSGGSVVFENDSDADDRQPPEPTAAEDPLPATATPTSIDTPANDTVTGLSAVAAASGPDLVVRNVTWSASPIRTGEYLDLSIVVENVGTTDVTESFTAEVYADGDLTDDIASDRYYASSNPIAPGETVALTDDWFVESATETLTASVDVYSDVTETDETNNDLTVPVGPFSGPDLVVRDLDWSPRNYTPGDEVTVTATVANVGDRAAALDSYDEFYVGLFANYTDPRAQRTRVDTQEISRLYAGSETSVSFTWEAQGGTLSLEIEPDTYEDVYELNESNNTAASPPVSVDPVDLSVTAVDYRPRDYLAGETVDLVATVTNTGPWTYDGPADVSFRLDNYRDSPSTVNQTSITLAPGEATNVTVAWTDSRGGTFNLTGRVDTYNELYEADEQNNSFTRVVDKPLANLVVDRLAIQGVAGEPGSAVVEVRNEGPASIAKQFRVRVQIGDRRGVDTYDRSFYGTVSGTFAAGETRNVTVPIDPVQAGDFDLISTVDYNAVVYETDESDNVRAKAVNDSTPDLIVTDLQYAPAGYAAGEQVQLNATVENVGNARWNGSVPTRFYYDTGYIARNYTDLDLPPGANATVGVTWSSAASGSYDLRAVVDGVSSYSPRGLIFETNETNNEYRVPAGAAQPDLTVTNVRTVPGDYAAGQTVRLVATIRNDGAGAYTGTLETRFSTNRSIDRYARFVDENATTVSLPSGGTTNVSVNWYDAAAGTVELIAVTDSGYDVGEANESNNVGRSQVSRPLPDFTVVSVNVTPAAYEREDATLEAVVENVGTGGYVGRLETTFYNGTRYAGANFTYESDYDGLLAPGDRLTVTRTTSAVRGRTLDLRATVDLDGDIRESDETNNASSRSFDRGRPDLNVTAVTLDPAAYAAGDDVVVNATIRNDGTAAWRDRTPVEFYINGSRYTTRYSTFDIAPGESTVVSYTWTNARAGTVDVRVVVDPYSDVAETSDTNNERTVRSTRPAPDLEVTALDWSPLGYAAGDTVTLNATVTNTGTGAWNGTSAGYAEFFYDNTSYIGSATIDGPIGPGESVTVTDTWYNAVSGEFQFRVVADVGDGVPESNESNNDLYVFSGREPADLLIRNVSVRPTDYAAGQPVTFEVTVENAGPGSWSGPLDTVLRRDDGTFVGSNRSTLELAANDTAVVTATWSRAQAGPVNVTARVDADDRAVEVDETNNAFVIGLDRPLPDLTVANVGYQPTGTLADELAVEVTVRNEGFGAVEGPVSIGLRNGTGAAAPSLDAVRPSLSLDAGTSTTVSARWTRPQPGPFTLAATVDDDGTLEEADETNNVGTTSGTLVAPNLRVTDLTLTPAEYVAGGEVTFTATVRNEGPGNWSGPVGLAVTRNRSGDPNGVAVLGETADLTLAAGESGTISDTWNDALAGTIAFTATVDPSTRIPETNESDNDYTVVSDRPAPDLTIEAVRPSTRRDTSSPSFGFEVVVRNVGDGTWAGPVLVTATENATDSFLDAASVETTLAPSGTVAVPLAWRNDEGGEVTAAFEVDPNDDVPESDETNNTRVETLSLPRTDLTVADVRLVSDEPVTADGQRVTYVADVRNDGTVAATGNDFVVEFRLDGEVQGTATAYSPTIGVGETLTLDLDARALGGATALTAVVDATDRYAEADETNNVATTAVDFGTAPDLTVEPIRVVGAGAAGDRARVYANVTNAGGATDRCLAVRFELDGERLGRVAQSVACGIGGGATRTAFYPWVVTPGEHTLAAVVDPDRRVPEADETNNRRLRTELIAAPDFTVTDLTVTPTSDVEAGDTVTLEATIRNDGPADYAATAQTVPEIQVGLAVRENGTSVQERYRSIDALDAGETATVRATWAAQPGSNFAAVATVDPYGRISEAVESNNATAVPLGVTVAPPDLRVVDVQYPTSGLVDGDSVTFDVTIRNDGPGRAVDVRPAVLFGGSVHAGTPVDVAPNASTTGQTRLLVRAGANQSVIGLADPFGSVRETNESNNGFDAGAVTVREREAFDIRTSTSSVTLSPGADGEFTVTTRNRGSATARVNLTVDGTGVRTANDKPGPVRASLFLGPGERDSRLVDVSVPDRCDVVGDHTITATAASNRTGATDAASVALSVASGPGVTAVLPADGDDVGTRTPTVTWRSRTNATSVVEYRLAGASQWQRAVDPGNRTVHAVTLPELVRNEAYEYRVESATPCGVSRSEVRTVTVTQGVAFVRSSRTFDVERAYDQARTLRITNTDTVTREVDVDLQNTYDDLIVGFVGPGSRDVPVRLAPGETVALDLRIHTQDARRDRYDVVATLSDTVANVTDRAPIRVRVTSPEVNVSVTPVDRNPATLARTYELRNDGDTLTDLSVRAVGENASRVGFDPAINHGRLAAGESTTVTVEPSLRPGGAGFTSRLEVAGAGVAETYPLDFSPTGDESVYVGRSPPTRLRFTPLLNNDTRPATNPTDDAVVRPTSWNGSPVFYGTLGVDVRQYHPDPRVSGPDAPLRWLPTPDVETALVVYNGTGREVVRRSSTAFGRVTFDLRLDPGVYTYRVVAPGLGAATEVRNLTVSTTPGGSFARGVTWTSIGDANSTVDGTEPNVTLDAAPYTVTAEVANPPRNASAYLVLAPSDDSFKRIVTPGELNGTTARFETSMIPPTTYDARVIVVDDSFSSAVYSLERSLTVTDASPSNFVERTDVRHFRLNRTDPDEQIQRVRFRTTQPLGEDDDPRKSIILSDVGLSQDRSAYVFEYLVYVNETIQDTLITRVEAPNGTRITYEERNVTLRPEDPYRVRVSVPVDRLEEGTTVLVETLDKSLSATGAEELCKLAGCSEGGAELAGALTSCAVGFIPIAGELDSLYGVLDDGVNGDDSKETDFAIGCAGLSAGAGLLPGPAGGIMNCGCNLIPLIPDPGPSGGGATHSNNDWRCTNRPSVGGPAPVPPGMPPSLPNGPGSGPSGPGSPTQPSQSPTSGGGSGGGGSGGSGGGGSGGSGGGSGGGGGTGPGVPGGSGSGTGSGDDDGSATSSGYGVIWTVDNETANLDYVVVETVFDEFWVDNDLGPFDTVYEFNGRRIGELRNEIPVGPYQFRWDDPEPRYVNFPNRNGSGTNYLTLKTEGLNPGHYAQNYGTTVNLFAKQRYYPVVASNTTEANDRLRTYVLGSDVKRPDALVASREFRIRESRPTVGDVVTVEGTVHNFGRSTAKGVDLRVSADGTVVDTVSVGPLAPGRSRTVTVRYRLTSVTTNLTLVADPDSVLTEESDANNVATRTVRAAAAGPSITVRTGGDASTGTAGGPGPVAFGTVPLGERVDRTVTIENDGTEALTVSSVRLDGTRDVSLDTSGPVTVAAGASRAVTVAFRPLTTGTVAGFLTVESDDPERPSVAVSVGGSGVLPTDVRRPVTPLVDYANTTRLSAGATSPANLAEDVRVDTTVVGEVAVRLTANDSGNVSITVDASSVGVAATNASDGGGTVTVYLRARTVARHQSLARTNLVVAGRPATLYAVAAAPSTDNETWLAFTVTAGEVQTASFRQSTVNFTATLPDPTAVGIPTDPNGDGLYEDLDGDGTQSYNDVVVLFRVLLSDEIQANAAAVDFNGNGRVDFDDVVTLFQGV